MCDLGQNREGTMSVTGQLISAAARRKRVPCPAAIATCATVLIAALGITAHGADLVPATDFGLRVQRGFEITLFADNDLVPDTWCMTIDARGRVVVANGSSIRTLSDDD